MGSFISKVTIESFLKSPVEHIDKCNLNTRLWIKFANLKASLSGKIENKNIKQFPHKNRNIRVDKICGFDFIIHEDLNLKSEISAGLQEVIFGDTIEIINSEKFDDCKYDFINDNNVALKLIKNEFKNCLPLLETKWDNWDSEITLKLLLFNGLGQCYVKKIINHTSRDPENSVYIVDLSEWEKYNVRDHFERYGGTAYFDSNLNFIGYVYKSKLIKKTDKNFKHINLIFRSTLITSITLKEHLITTHWIAANGILISSLKYLGHTHILRRFLRSFTFGTAAINHASTLALAPFEGIAGRTFAFTNESWIEMINDQISLVKFESIKEKFDNSALSEDFKINMPFYSDGLELWEINKKYVSNFIDIYYPDENHIEYDYELKEYWNGLKKYFTTKIYDIGTLNKNNLINHLTYSIFMVTAGHSFYGSVCEYLLTPDALMPKVLIPKVSIVNTLKNSDNKIYENITRADTQTYIQALCIISMTSTPMPKLINDWEFLFDNTVVKKNKTKYNLMKENLKAWQSDLIILSKKINNLNKTRQIEFNCFNPDVLDCSVSV